MFSYRIDEELELRLIEERHAGEYFALCDRNRNRFYWIKQDYSLEDARSFLKRDLTENFARSNGFQAGIWVRGVLVGAVRYNDINWISKSTSLGGWIDSSFEGQGLITRATVVLINYAFSELKLNRLEAHCHSENRRSRAMAEKLGFTQEGILREAELRDDRFVDVVVYGLLATEWKGHAGKILSHGSSSSGAT